MSRPLAEVLSAEEMQRRREEADGVRVTEDILSLLFEREDLLKIEDWSPIREGSAWKLVYERFDSGMRKPLEE